MFCGKKIQSLFLSQWTPKNHVLFTTRLPTYSQRYSTRLDSLRPNANAFLPAQTAPQIQKLNTYSNFLAYLKPQVNRCRVYSQISNNQLRNDCETLTTGLFGNSAFKSPESICQYAKDRSEQAHALVKQISAKSALLESSPSLWELKDTVDLIDSFDTISNTICLCTDAAELIRTLHPDPSYIQAAETAYDVLSSIVHTLNTHTGLYHILFKALQLHASNLTPMQRHNAQVFLRDFESAGIHLSHQHHQNYALLSKDISYHMRDFLTFNFPPLTVDLKKSELDEIYKHRLLDDSVLLNSLSSLASEKTSPFTIKEENVEVQLTYSDAHQVLSGSDLPSVRKKIFNAIHAPHVDQEKNLIALLTKRHELANVLGHRSFADWFLQDKMLNSPEKVAFFLNCEAKHLLPKLNSTLQSMLRHQLEEERSFSFQKPNKIQPWDTTYYLSKETLSNRLPYWSTSPVEVFIVFQRLIKKLYNVDCIPTPCSSQETWDPSITKWTLFHGDKGFLGTIYCDARSHDSSCLDQAAHFTVQCKSTLFNQPGVVVIRLPFRTSNEQWRWHHVETAYHELGHAMHALLSLSPYQNTSGTRCAFDIGEIPSILMELLAQDDWTRHQFLNKAPEPFPMTPWDSAQQLLSSIYDLSLHSCWTPSIPLDHWFDQLHTQPEFIFSCHYPDLCDFLRCLPWTSGMRPYLRFQHLATYASGYYTYLWCRKLATCIYQKLFQHQHDQWTSQGQFLWEEFLGWGGGRDPWECMGVILQEMDRKKLFHQICQSKN